VAGHFGEPLELRLEGDLDAYSAPDVRSQLHGLIEQSGTGGVLVVDLTRVTFMDSSILGALVGALRRIRERDGELRLVYPPQPVKRIFELTGLDGVFPTA
jgi:anti-sigma B factor antagonist